MTSSGSSSSSSGSGQSDDDEFVVAPSAPPPVATPANLGAVQELAQICHFCATFRAPLKLSVFTRTELQAALLDAANPNESQLALLAELHFKLTRDQTGVKLERMIQDWEKAVARKLAENWQLEFLSNPMANTSYAELSVLDRRGSEIGTDDKGVSYWYFDDGCWVYAEDKPQWQLKKRDPQYVVEFANGKRIRLSINFDADVVAADHQPLLITATKTDIVKDILPPSNQDDNDTTTKEIPEEKHAHDVNEKRAKFSILNEEKEDILPPTKEETVVVATAEMALLPSVPVAKEEVRPVSRKMDITMICGSPSSDDMSAKSEPQQVGNGQAKVVEKLDALSTNGNVKTEQQANGFSQVADTSPQPIVASKPLVVTFKAETKENLVENEVSQDSSKTSPIGEDSALLGNAKKRVIVDDDNSDSSDAANAKKMKSESNVKSISLPQKKKQKTEPDAAKETPEVPAIPTEKPDSTVQVQVASDDSAAPTKLLDVKVTATHPAEKVASKEESKALESNGAVIGLISTENFDINCECCQKDYDMRYLDPPLVERPAGEWRCFECLVNDARGWPRRRKSTASPTAKTDPTEEKSKSSSSKKSSSSSSAKRSRPSSTKSSSGKTASSSSKRKKSSGNSTSTSKKSSSSSKKKHKKKKSSSSSHSHHSSSSHRRRHHQEYSKLLVAFQARNKERLSIEECRIHDSSRHNVELLESPASWRVVSSTLDSLRGLIETLAGGSLEQERLRSRLISILKIQEKLEEERIKRQELAWQILPRRQSSRIAIGKMRNQSSGSEGSEDELSGEETGKGRRRVHRSSSTRTRSADLSADSAGVDSKQQLALERASRARRRQIQEETDGNGNDEEDEEEENPGSISPGDWINWSILKGNKRSLSTVCLAAVDRLLKEEISELFGRPVDPEFDGCPDYLTIITHPMDLGTIRTRLGAGFYKKWEAFKVDVERVWDNCREFNGTETVISDYADTLGALFKQMCKVAEKRGVRAVRDDGDAVDGGASDGHEDEHISSSGDESKAESRTSANKEWTESSEPESSGGSSDDDSDNSSDDSAGGKRKGKAAQPARNRTAGRAKQQPIRSSPSGSAAARPSRTRALTAKTTTKRSSSWKSDDDDDDDESELSLSDGSDDDVSTRGRRVKQKPAAAAPARAVRTTTAAIGRQVSPSTPKKPRNASAQQASPKSILPKKPEASAPASPPPPPPPPARVEQKSPAASGKSPRPLAATRPSRLRISDGSSSSDSDDKVTSSSSSSSSSDDSVDSDSDSDADLHSAPPQPKELIQSPASTKKVTSSSMAAAAPPPPPPSAKKEPLPPPPPPSPPTSVAAVAQPPPPPKQKQRATKQSAKVKGQKSNANNKKSKVSPRVAVLKLDNVTTLGGGLASSSYANSPTLLNSYLSPSSSSSSYFSSSAESDSSDSDSDDGGSD